jgi:catechol 2,3-dioxygenase-like lactoylglutathione lyase family enzyme
MMSNPAPIPRLTAVTLGVRDFHASLLFYETLGFARRLRATGDEVAFLDAGGVVLALYPWDKLAQDAAVSTPDPPRLPEREGEGEVPARFRGTTLAWNCTSRTEVDAAFGCALAAGATLLKAAQETSWGGYSGYFADPDGHPWEIVHAPGLPLSPAGQLRLPD